MPITHFFVTPVTIHHANTLTDRYGDTRPDWDNATTTEATGWLTQLDGSEQLNLRDAEVSDHRLFLPAGTAIAADDRVVSDGVTYEVTAPPHRARTPSSVHHLEVLLRAVEG